MILLWLILVPLLAGLVAWAVGRENPRAARLLCLAACLTQLTAAAILWSRSAFPLALELPWIPQLGIGLTLFLDGLSLLLVLLTGLLGALAVLSAWDVDEHVGFFHFNLMATLTGVTGVFLARDLILFYLFWELMLVPLFLLIRIWGGERRLQAALKFFLFTQAGGLGLLLGILGLAFAHHRATGQFTFDYLQLLATPLSATEAFWLMLAFFLGFAMKLPALPLHPWLPDAHSQAPTAGSVVLAGLVLKAGGYGLLRFLMPLFPQAGLDFAPVAMTLAVAGILYGAALAFAQTDLKRLIACSSISHMGFVLLGVFAFNELALQGALVVMIAHGLATGSLFALAGAIHHRLGTLDMNAMGGLWARLPKLGGVTLFFVLATLGLPGLAGFVGEFLVLLGTWQAHPVLAVLAAGGMVLSVLYALQIIQKVFHGTPSLNPAPLHPDASPKSPATAWPGTGPGTVPSPDLTPREWIMSLVMIAATLYVGLAPQRLLDASAPAVRQIQQTTSDLQATEARP